MTPVMGLDLSLTGTGISCADHTDVLKPPKSAAGVARLDWIRTSIIDHIKGEVPLVVIEGYSMGGQRGSAGVAQMLGELGGLIRWTLWRTNIPYVDVSPATLKKAATGKGNASKDEVLSAAVRAGYGGSNNNSADAWYLRQIGMYWVDPPNCLLPRTNYRDEAIAKIMWPESVAA